MFLSDISVKRPVFASVLSLLLIAFGIVSFTRLSLREYPAIDPPVVSITVDYPGASASIVETRITQVIENRISGIEGIEFIESSSQDGRARITLQFNIERDIDSAANDVRDRVAGAARNLPEEADAPQVQKSNSDDDVIVWYALVSETMSVPELTDYAQRYLVEQFSVLNGVSTVRVGGAQTYAMRVWLDRSEMAARGITASDVENALRTENVELPAGSIESGTRQFTMRMQRNFNTEDDFKNLVLRKGDDNYLVRLGDIATVERGTVENRILFRGDGLPRVGLGIAKQSTANTLAVAREAQDLVNRINTDLPPGMHIQKAYDSSIFIAAAVREVYKTLAIAIGLVVFMIYAFLGSWRATLIPAITVPVSLIGTFTVIYAFGFSLNMLTLLALILAISLVIDDAIIVLENIMRRIRDKGEPPLLAAYRGTRQVAFAVVATTLVLVAVFVPITFLQGDLGRLFTEFALTIAAAIVLSSICALSLTAMMTSKIIKGQSQDGNATKFLDRHFKRLRGAYVKVLAGAIRKPLIVIACLIALCGLSVMLFRLIPSEYTPTEDRGSFIVLVNGPEGASFSYMEDYMDEIENRLLPYVGPTGEIQTMILRAPRGFGTLASFNTGMLMVVLNDWGTRRPAQQIIAELRQKLSDLPGVRVNLIMRQGFTSASSRPVQFVIGGGTYEQLAQWRDILVEKVNDNNPGLINLDWNYKETKPQFEISIDYDRAAELGISVSAIGRTLETMMGSRRVTTYIDNGEEYDVILEGIRDEQRSRTALENIYVKSGRTGALIPLSSVVTVNELADAASLNRYNRVRAITLEADLADGYTLGKALEHMASLTRQHLPDNVVIDYRGQSRDFMNSRGSVAFIFILGLVVVFLILAAQFESYIHPLVIILTVPLAMAGGLLGLYLTGNSLNIYSQIGLLTLIGLSAKNGILIVEFTNQMRDAGASFNRALLTASQLRLRPILMTNLTTAAGAIPLLMASGAGAETRIVIGVVIFAGVLSATLFTIFVVPVAYSLLARKTGSPLSVTHKLLTQEKQAKSSI